MSCVSASRHTGSRRPSIAIALGAFLSLGYRYKSTIDHYHLVSCQLEGQVVSREDEIWSFVGPSRQPPFLEPREACLGADGLGKKLAKSDDGARHSRS